MVYLGDFRNRKQAVVADYLRGTAEIFVDDAQMTKEHCERCLDRKIDREVICKIRRMTN